MPEMQVVQGLGVAEGVAIGRAVCLVTRAVDVYRFPIADDDLDAEVERLREAVRRTEQEIRRTQSGVGEELGKDLAEIFEAHVLMLADKAFVERIVERIRSEKANAEWAVHRTTEELVDRFTRLDDARLRERADDLRDVSRYLLRMLQGIAHHELADLEEDVVIVADDLTPSDAVRLGRQRVIGLAVESGGRTSHTTIIARSLNIPLVTGLVGMVDRVTDEDKVIVDGERGTLILHPTPEVLAEYASRQGVLRDEEAVHLTTRDLPATSLDGVEVTLQANIDLPEEIGEATRFGARGVGLYRSEFLYIEMSPRMPSEDDHYRIYRQLAEEAAPYPAIIRTYDLGGRKLAREVMDTREDNPVLGLRGIRLTLARPQVFRTQLRGLYRAGLHGEIWVMLPLVSTVEEVRKFRAFAGDVTRELAADGVAYQADIKIGAMLEVPSAAIITDLLAREVDFFSVGTNDLIQYSLAVDRNNEHVTDLYQPLHPALLRMLRFAVQSAGEAGREIGVCGEMAGDPRFVPLLLGLGIRRLSMSPRAVPRIKTLIRGLRVDAVREAVEECMNLPTAAEVEERLNAVGS